MKTTTIIVTVVAVAVALVLISTAVSASNWTNPFYMNQRQTSSGSPGVGMMGGFQSNYGGGYGSGGMMGGYGGNYGGSYTGGMMGGYGGGMMGGNYGNYGGMMGGNYGYGGMMTIQGQSISIQQAIQTMQSTPSYAKVIQSNNTIVYSSQDVSIFALAIMPEKAVNLTGLQPPSYSTDDVFVISGLINPTLVIPAGASVHFTVANLDDDMYHNLLVSSISPPYPYMAMHGMMYSNPQSGSYPFISMMGFLPPADYNAGSAHEYSYTVSFNQPGSLWYLCGYPGHAQSGMYGQILMNA